MPEVNPSCCYHSGRGRKGKALPSLGIKQSSPHPHTGPRRRKPLRRLSKLEKGPSNPESEAERGEGVLRHKTLGKSWG